jgi:hypothetical protein
MMGMGDKRNRHPSMDGLAGGVDLVRVARGTGGEQENSPNRQYECHPDSQRATPVFSHTSNLTARWLLTALTEQLGLRVETRKSPDEVLAIDSIAMPSDN